MSGLIDTHCHLDKVEDVDYALEVARASGVEGIVTIGTRWSRRSEQLQLTENSSNHLKIWCALGTHPDYAHEESLPELDDMVKALGAPCVVAIGESGLDYFHGTEEVKPAQHAMFRRHIEAARVTQLPLVIHARQADDDVISILRDEHKKGAFPFLIHCFASGETLAKAALELGGYISFSGLLTFPKCEEIRKVACKVPEDRMLVETDSPFLAPVPKRGRPNTPGYVAHTAARLAQERGVTIEYIIEKTTQNAYRLFSKAHL